MPEIRFGKLVVTARGPNNAIPPITGGVIWASLHSKVLDQLREVHFNFKFHSRFILSQSL